ncbi:MAG TPA: DMT family transporter [Acidobacteriaceae bacterium]|nr:DMT family transporter [Acidobacteriaceae bacterium]
MTGAQGMAANPAATVGLSLTSAAIWGTSDFVGGIAARRLPSSAVVTLSHSLSLVMLVSLALMHASAWPDPRSARYGALAGLSCGTGVMVLYKALALGGMGLTAAVSGVLAAVLPVVWAFSTEGLPRVPQLAGIVLAAIAIWMIARAPGSPSSKQAILLGAAAGASFGCLFILLKLAGRGGVLWPLAWSRVASATLAAVVTWIGTRTGTRRTGNGKTEARAKLSWPGWTVLGLIAIAGIFDASGNTFYTIATRLGRLDIAAVLSSLYPAATIVLATVLLKERTTRSQAAGMALALVAVALISL